MKKKRELIILIMSLIILVFGSIVLINANARDTKKMNIDTDKLKTKVIAEKEELSLLLHEELNNFVHYFLYIR